MADHMRQTQHMEYFQTYGNILPNIGHFHYSLTMLRSLVKLEWDIHYSELVKSIHFESPKALFSQQKVTDFRKSLDTFRIARTAKLRELVTPFVRYAKENKLDINVPAYSRACHQPCLTPGSTLGYTRVNPRAAVTACHQGQPWCQPGSTLLDPRVNPGDNQG